MKFSEEQIDLALSRLGCSVSLPKVIDFIISDRVGGSSGKQSRTDAMLHELFRIRDRTLKLLDMGFSEEEVSTAIEIFGPAVAADELADAIFANRISDGCVKEETDTLSDKGIVWSQNESKRTSETINGAIDTDEWETKPSTSSATIREREWEDITIADRKRGRLQDPSKLHQKQKAKIGKVVSVSNASSVDMSEYEEKFFDNKVHTKGVCGQTNSKYRPSPPPFVFFGNMADSSQETWDKLSRFLYGFDPEFVNTQFFSAFIRKEGYFHNLPTTNRFHILPRPPMTIEKALPQTKKWWPSWDTRKQLGCINSDCTDVVQTCERLGRTMVSSRGILSKEQQTDILHQCKTLNLLWVGERKLQPLKADHVENILGYSVGHTNITGLEEPDRLIALKFSFQVDTIGYHLSTLKPLYPAGLRVLSIFTGIGGAEIALTKLGIHLLCVVSVEASEINRAIFKRWWRSSGQSGELRQVGGIEKLRGQKIDSLLNEFGGFDLIISGNPHNYIYGNPHAHDADGVDFTLFYESVRIYQHVRNVMARRGSPAS